MTVATNGSVGFEGFGVKKDFGNAVVDFLRVDGERTTLRVSGFAGDVVGVVASMSDVSLPLTVVCGLRETGPGFGSTSPSLSMDGGGTSSSK